MIIQRELDYNFKKTFSNIKHRFLLTAPVILVHSADEGVPYFSFNFLSSFNSPSPPTPLSPDTYRLLDAKPCCVKFKEPSNPILYRCTISNLRDIRFQFMVNIFLNIFANIKHSILLIPVQSEDED